MNSCRRLATALVIGATATTLVAADDAGSCFTAGDGATAVCESVNYLHAADRVGNLGAVSGTYTTFDGNPPTATEPAVSFGSAEVEPVIWISTGDESSVDENGLTIDGTFTGPLDRLGIELLTQQPVSNVNNHFVSLAILVDGVEVFEPTFIEATLSTEVPWMRAPIAATNLAAKMAEADLDLSADAEHTIHINVTPVCEGNEVAYFYDSTSAPAQLILNPASLDGFHLPPS